jgi:hypothetical protein
LWFEHNVAAPDIFYFSTEKVRGFETSGLSHKWEDVGLTQAVPHVGLSGRTDRTIWDYARANDFSVVTINTRTA